VDNSYLKYAYLSNLFFFSSRRRHTRFSRDWSADVCSSDRADPRHSIRLQAYAEALDAYQKNPDLNYVRLLDGGLTDNLGITGFALERAAADTPHGPLSAEEAVKLRHFIFVIADAGRGQTEKWGRNMQNLPLGTLLTAPD